MKRPFPRLTAAGLSVAVALSACSGARRSDAGNVDPRPGPAARTDNGPNAADALFMSGMIPHHAQAVLIAGWAPSHGASDAIRRLCERIVVGQQDEIALMRTWLQDQNQPVPDANATHLRMKMNGGDHDMLMPGMLNAEELARLDRARGVEFDRLFLQAMIKHHEGAISMVDQLFASQGAGQDEIVFRFASDVYADQTTEIDHMQKMLAALP